jgi:metallo-beta-lactamase family protein
METTLSFLGAARNVTGSRFLLQANGNTLLIDCGLYQERDFLNRNWDPFPVPPSSIGAVLLTHAHLDHTGYLPRLVRDGFAGRIYCTAATAEITKIILQDSANLQEEDILFKQKRHRKEGRQGAHPEVPLYTPQDVENCLPLFHPMPYARPALVGQGIEISFHDAGHILGSSMIKVRVASDGQARTILFSGDVGRWDKPILRDPTIFDQADFIVVESTYGDRLHEKGPDIKDRLDQIIHATLRAGGNLVIPSFSVERAQEVLYYFNELLCEDRIPHLLTFLDSPMAVKVTEIFRNHSELYDDETVKLIHQCRAPWEFPGLVMSRTTTQSKAINQISGTVAIIAGSGMCTGGRIKHHLANNISRPESTILFVGYQASGTLGRNIVNGAKKVRIHGQDRLVRAKIVRIPGFSGHADRDELMRWLSGIQSPPKQVFIVHGEEESAESFRKYLTEKTHWPAVIPHYGDQVRLN